MELCLEWMMGQVRTACEHWSALYIEPNMADDVGVCCTLPHQAEVVNEAFFVQLEEFLCSQAWCLWATSITLLKRKHMYDNTQGRTQSAWKNPMGYGPGEKKGPRELLDFQGSPYPSST